LVNEYNKQRGSFFEIVMAIIARFLKGSVSNAFQNLARNLSKHKIFCFVDADFSPSAFLLVVQA